MAQPGRVAGTLLFGVRVVPGLQRGKPSPVVLGGRTQPAASWHANGRGVGCGVPVGLLEHPCSAWAPRGWGWGWGSP